MRNTSAKLFLACALFFLCATLITTALIAGIARSITPAQAAAEETAAESCAGYVAVAPFNILNSFDEASASANGTGTQSLVPTSPSAQDPSSTFDYSSLVPVLLQYPDIPAGCEIYSLTAVLQALGLMQTRTTLRATMCPTPLWTETMPPPTAEAPMGTAKACRRPSFALATPILSRADRPSGSSMPRTRLLRICSHWRIEACPSSSGPRWAWQTLALQLPCQATHSIRWNIAWCCRAPDLMERSASWTLRQAP